MKVSCHTSVAASLNYQHTDLISEGNKIQALVEKLNPEMAKVHLQKEKGLVDEEDDSVDNSKDQKSPLSSTQDEFLKLKREFNRFKSNSSDEFDDRKPAAIVPQSTQGEFAALQTEFSEFQLEQSLFAAAL
jgi:HAMP domain-containing protein